MHQEEVSRVLFNKEFKQVIVKKEVILARGVCVLTMEIWHMSEKLKICMNVHQLVIFCGLGIGQRAQHYLQKPRLYLIWLKRSITT